MSPNDNDFAATKEAIRGMVEGNLMSTRDITGHWEWWPFRILSIVTLPVESMLRSEFGMGYFSVGYLMLSATLLLCFPTFSGNSVDFGLIVLGIAAGGCAIGHLSQCRQQWRGEAPWMFSVYDGKPWVVRRAGRWLTDTFPDLPKIAMTEYQVKCLAEPIAVAALGLGLMLLPGTRIGLFLVVSAVAMAGKSFLMYGVAMTHTMEMGNQGAKAEAQRRERERYNPDPADACGYYKVAQMPLNLVEPHGEPVALKAVGRATKFDRPDIANGTPAAKTQDNNGKNPNAVASCPSCKKRIQSGRVPPPAGTSVACPGCRVGFKWPA